jgi:hypothetical protein
MGKQDLNVVLRKNRSGDVIGEVSVHADPDDHAALQRLLRDLVVSHHWDADRVSEFTLEVRDGTGSFLKRVTDGG